MTRDQEDHLELIREESRLRSELEEAKALNILYEQIIYDLDNALMRLETINEENAKKVEAYIEKFNMLENYFINESSTKCTKRDAKLDSELDSYKALINGSLYKGEMQL